MVEYKKLDHIFNSLADATRRDILKRVAKKELSVGEIAQSYDLTFAAVSKHLKVLEKAELITKQRRGKHQYVLMSGKTLAEAQTFLKQYAQAWEDRMDSLAEYLKDNR